MTGESRGRHDVPVKKYWILHLLSLHPESVEKIQSKAYAPEELFEMSEAHVLCNTLSGRFIFPYRQHASEFIS